MSQKIGEVHQTSQGDLSKATANAAEPVLGGVKTRGIAGQKWHWNGFSKTRCLKMRTKFSTGSRQQARRWTRSSGSASACSVSIRNSLSRLTADCWTWEMTRGGSFRLRCASTPIPSPKNIFCRMSTPSDYALMFVPSEGVFYELIMTQESKYGALDEYCRSKRVYPVSPNTVCAIVGSIAMSSCRARSLRKNARHLLANLSGLQKQLDSLRGSVRKAGNTFAECATELRRRRQQAEPCAQQFGTDVAGRAHRWRAEGAATCNYGVEQHRRKMYRSSSSFSKQASSPGMQEMIVPTLYPIVSFNAVSKSIS